MKLSLCLAMVAYMTSNLAWAEACEVTTHAASPEIKVVDARTCYEYTGMPTGAINWSCSNESKDALATRKQKVDQCPTGASAACRATLTQEALANPRSTSKEPGSDSANIPKGAQVITWYYDINDTSQARIDCEQDGGTWSLESR